MVCGSVVRFVSELLTLPVVEVLTPLRRVANNDAKEKGVNGLPVDV